MCLQALSTLLVLTFLSNEANGATGTQSNHFPFVELGLNGVDFSTFYFTSATSYINPGIHLGSATFNYAQMSSEGYIYFHSDSSSRPYSPFSYNSWPNYIIAPFWDNQYVGDEGPVKYEVHTSGYTSSLSRKLRDKVGAYISTVLGVYVRVDSLLVVEWKGMTPSSYNDYHEANTFQALITSSEDGHSFAVFTYKCGDLQWSKLPTIGFKGDGSIFRNHPFSRNISSPNPIACVNYPKSVWSNVVYRIDSSTDPCYMYDQFGCSSGYCVPMSDVCDGFPQCADGTDEVACAPVRCYSNQVACRGGGCVIQSKACDGTWDCSDGSDESGCNSFSTGGIIGIVCGGLVVILVFAAVIISSISHQIKQRNRRRAQFQRLQSQISVRPQATPQTQTLYFHPKPGEWYQTIEGNWVQGPPPAYSLEVEQGNPPTDEGAGLLVNESSATTPPNVEVSLVEVTSLPVSGSVADPSATVEVSQPEGEMGEVSDEGNPLESSSSDSSVLDNENSPLIES